MVTSAGTQLFWYVGRGSGIVAYILLTFSVALGILLSRRWHSPRWPRLVVDGAHRWLTISFYLFVVIHVLMMLVDPFAHFSVRDLTIPFASDYRPIWLSLGIIAAELGLAIGATVWVRRWIGYRTWHAIHGLSYVIFAASLLHSLGTGTDTRTAWATLLYGGSVVLVLGLLVWRVAPVPALRVGTVAASLVAAVALVAWSIHGPYAPGWAAAAGTPANLLNGGAGQTTSTTVTDVSTGMAPSAAAGPVFPSTFHDTVSGPTIVVGNRAEVLLRGSATGDTPLDAALQLEDTRGGIGGEVQLRTADHTALCDGPISGDGLNQLTATCVGYGHQLHLTISLQRLDRDGFAATIDGSSRTS